MFNIQVLDFILLLESNFQSIFLSIAKVRIGNLNVPDKPISLQKQRVGLESTPQCHLKVDWVITFIHIIFLIGEENEVQKIPLHSKESLPVKKNPNQRNHRKPPLDLAPRMCKKQAPSLITVCFGSARGRFRKQPDPFDRTPSGGYNDNEF